jgi:hypothetical protein
LALAQRSAHIATSAGAPFGENFSYNPESTSVDRRLLLATFALPLLPACASRTKFDQAPFNPILLGPHEGLDNWPMVGAETTVEVGAVVAKTFNYVKLPALEVPSTYRKARPIAAT